MLLDLINQQGARSITLIDTAARTVKEIERLLGIPSGITVLHLNLHERSLPEGEERFLQQGITHGQSLRLKDILAGGFCGEAGLLRFHRSDHVADFFR